MINARNARNLLLGLRPLKEPVAGPEAGKRGLRGLLAWTRKMSLDCLICRHNGALEQLRASGVRVPEDIGFASPDWNASTGPISGMRRRHRQVGQAAVELIVERLYHQQTGIPLIPRTILIEGAWRAGGTTASRKGGGREANS